MPPGETRIIGMKKVRYSPTIRTPTKMENIITNTANFTLASELLELTAK